MNQLSRQEKRKLFKGVDLSELKVYEVEINKLIDSAFVSVSNIKPSDWVEQNRMMTIDVSAIPGMFSYNNSPYTREIIDCLAVDHPAKIIGVMKGAQIGFSAGVIEGGIGYIMSQNPGNILFLVGHESLVDKAMTKVDNMIHNSGLRELIKSNSNRARNTKSGDTDKEKQFPNGSLTLGIANHKAIRQVSMRYGFIDDFESMKSSSKESGSTRKLVEQRFASYAHQMKLFYISTPEVKETSNIEPVYLLGDQRKYHIPCPCCSEYIYFEWEIESEKDSKEMAGITWKLDEKHRLIPESVGYICQKCGGFFDDRNKTDLIRKGKWIPTAEPSEPGYYSYHISSLYAPPFMFGWERYVRNYMELHPFGGERDEAAYATFRNLVLGYTSEITGKSLSATQLQQNIRPYEIGIIPEKLSIADGNGKIVMITCGSDLNGNEDDARLDYEIVAYSESGAKYSIDHGSIGTFIPRDNGKTPRDKWTYRHGATNSVWPEFEKIISQYYLRDSDNKAMKIFITGVDTGHLPNYAYQFVDNSNYVVVSLKGDDFDKSIREEADIKTYKKSTEKGKLYLVASNHTKNLLSRDMDLKWNPELNTIQPYGFMNFPTPTDGKYLLNNYFSHFEAEHKIVEAKTKKYVWKKKSTNHQNHLFDCRLYADVVRDIFMDNIFKAPENKIINGTWSDYVEIALRRRK